MSREELPAHAVILAGGRGTRFWPRSRTRTPKQLLNIVGRDSMLEQTAARLAPLFPASRQWVVTNSEQAAAVRRQLPRVAASHILAELLDETPRLRSVSPPRTSCTEAWASKTMRSWRCSPPITTSRTPLAISRLFAPRFMSRMRADRSSCWVFRLRGLKPALATSNARAEKRSTPEAFLFTRFAASRKNLRLNARENTFLQENTSGTRECSSGAYRHSWEISKSSCRKRMTH